MINKLTKIVAKRKKRLGHGMGSGKGGHTSGRGMKGQKARGVIYPLFEGTKTKKSLLQRLPLQRGKGKLKPRKRKPFLLDLESLNKLPQKSIVDLPTLVKSGIVDKSLAKYGVKILSYGELKNALTIRLPVSFSAREKIQKAGGVVESAQAEN